MKMNGESFIFIFVFLYILFNVYIHNLSAMTDPTRLSIISVCGDLRPKNSALIMP